MLLSSIQRNWNCPPQIWTNWSRADLSMPLQTKRQGIICCGTGWRWHCTRWSKRPNSLKTLKVVSQSSPRSHCGWQTVVPRQISCVRQIEELQKQIASLQAGKKGLSLSSRRSFICWNCRKRGHLARNCKCSKIGDMFTFRSKHKKQVDSRSKDETSILN